MPIRDRAAQFAPFAALTGYDGVIEETARITDTEDASSEEGAAILDRKLRLLNDVTGTQPYIEVTYFIPDINKDGGMYLDFTGNIKKYDAVDRKVHFTDNTEISADDIIDINSEILPLNTEDL